MSTWKLAAKLFRYNKALMVLSLVLYAIVWTIPLASGLLGRTFFNRLTAGAVAWPFAAGMFATDLVRHAFWFVAMIFYVRMWNMLLTVVRANLLDWIMRGPGAGELPDSAGEAVARFRDDANEFMLFIDTWVDAVGAFIFGVIAVIIMARINALMTCVVLLPLATIVVVTRLATERLRNYRRASRKASAAVTGFIGELFGAVQAIKVASAEDGAIDKFKALNDERKSAVLRDRIWTELTWSFNSSSVNVSIGLVLVLAARAMSRGTFTVGDFTLFTTYLWTLSNVPRMLGVMFARERQVGISVERLQRLLKGASPEALVAHSPVYLDGEPPALEPVAPPEDLFESLEVRALTFHHPGSARGIEAVSLDVRHGEFVVVTGRIGSGKTTLLRSVLGLVHPEAGAVLWNGRPVTSLEPPRTAYVAQVPRLFSEKLRDNIMLGSEGPDLQEALRLAVLEPDVASMAEGLDTVVGPRGVRLSGGQMQRAAAARMFTRGAQLLVVDDLSSALDVETERTLWERLFAFTDATCLVVSHRRPALRRADRIVLMRDGRVDDVGTLDELMGRNAEMRALWSAEPDDETARFGRVL